MLSHFGYHDNDSKKHEKVKDEARLRTRRVNAEGCARISRYHQDGGGFLKKPGVQMVAKIAKALGVTVEDLLK